MIDRVPLSALRWLESRRLRRLCGTLAVVAGLSASIASAATLAASPVPQASLPAEVKFVGKLVAARRWTDRSGENWVVLSSDRSSGDEGRSVDLHATGYRRSNGQIQKTWQVNEGIGPCLLDLIAFFSTGSLDVTDLDGNGLAEISFVYRLACNGGMDYIEEKLFLVEDGHKYPVRGRTEFTNPDDESEGHYDGPMFVDLVFKSAPKVFRQYAEQKWRRFRDPSIGEPGAH